MRIITTICILFLMTVPVFANQSEDFDITFQNIELRPGVIIDLHVAVYVNEDHHCDDKTILTVHGANLDATMWSGFAEAIFDQNPTGSKVCKVAAIDMPGHGGSILHGGGPLFGQLTVYDYTQSLLAALENLPGYGVQPKSIIGYSMGGAVVILAQQMLTDSGTNLRSEFNIKTIVLLAPSPPEGFPFILADQFSPFSNLFYFCYSGEGGGLKSGMCATIDVDMDGDVDFSDFAFVFPEAKFDCDATSTPLGIPPLPAPPPGLCDPLTGLGDTVFRLGGYESATVYLQLSGGFQYQRPQIDADIFGSIARSQLQIVSFENDVDVASEQIALYEHLTGDFSDQGHVTVEGSNATHAMPVIYPSQMLGAIAGVVKLP
jgi:pimeloyl-ACP methyl ester carboxylesterase